MSTQPVWTIQIGFSYFDPSFGLFWSIVSHCLRQEAERQGIRLALAPVASTADQAEAVQHFVKSRVDALILAPLASDAPEIVAAVRKADEAGIPVIALDSKVGDDHVACLVQSDNVYGAELAAGHVLDRLGGQGEVVHLQGDLRTQAGQQRSQGVHRALARRPDVRLVFEAPGDWTRETGVKLMHLALAAHPGIRAVVAGNDGTALGAGDAIAEAGRAGQILIAGFDAMPEALLAIRDGQMEATVSRSVESIAREALDVALRAMRGQAVPPHILTAVALVTAAVTSESARDVMDFLPGVLRDLTESQARPRPAVEALPDRVDLLIRDTVEVAQARSRGLNMALRLGFPPREATKIAVVISELGRSIISYGRCGIITLTAEPGEDACFEIVARDRGPGIRDIARAMAGGHLLPGGLGPELSGSERLMDTFVINSAPGVGTTVTARKKLHRS